MSETRTIDRIQGNEYVINLAQSTYDDYGGYWIELAEERAKATKRETVIVVDDVVKYRSTQHVVTGNERREAQ
jgi:adenine/guanine phosphoribosyltransferase-like PRPP-binding protein